MNSHLPEECGAWGASYPGGCLIGEELTWGCAASPTTLGANDLTSAPVLLGGSDEITRDYFGMLTEQPKLAPFCLTSSAIPFASRPNPVPPDGTCRRIAEPSDSPARAMA